MISLWNKMWKESGYKEFGPQPEITWWGGDTAAENLSLWNPHTAAGERLKHKLSWLGESGHTCLSHQTEKYLTQNKMKPAAELDEKVNVQL